MVLDAAEIDRELGGVAEVDGKRDAIAVRGAPKLGGCSTSRRGMFRWLR